MLSHCLQPNFSLQNTTREFLDTIRANGQMFTAVSQGFFWPMSQARCSHDNEFTFKYWHLQVVHLKMFTLPGASHTCHLQTSSSKCFTLFTQGAVFTEYTRRCWRWERGAPTEELLWTRCRGGARGRHTRRSWQRFLTRRQRSIFGVRKEYLESEIAYLDSGKHIFGVREA